MKGVAVVRYLVAVWLVCLGSAFCALGQWWGAFLFPVAGGVGALAYLMPRWKLAIEAEKLEAVEHQPHARVEGGELQLIRHGHGGS